MPFQPSQSKKVWEQVKKNHAALDGCVGPHDFRVIDGPKKVFRDFRCTKCGGEIDAIKKHWYDEGLKHGRLPA
jgi:hypothetical protein